MESPPGTVAIGLGAYNSPSGGTVILFAERKADLRRIADAITAYLDGRES